MTFALADRTKDTQSGTITGTGSYTLTGTPPTGFQSFLSGVGDGNSTIYCATNGTSWEVCAGVYTDSTKALTRNLIDSSTGSLISWSAATPSVFVVNPANLTNLFRAKFPWNASRFYGQSGVGNLTTRSGNLTVVFYVPLVIEQPVTLNSIGVEITVGGTGTAYFGLYDVNLGGASAGLPNNLLSGTTGSGSLASTGALQVTGLSKLLLPGLYFGAVGFGGSAAATVRAVPTAGPVQGLFGQNAVAASATISGVTQTIPGLAALPSTATPVLNDTGSFATFPNLLIGGTPL